MLQRKKRDTENKIDENETNSKIADKIKSMKDYSFNMLLDEEIKIEGQPKYLITPVHLTESHGVIYPYYGIIESEGLGYAYYSRSITISQNGNIDFAYIIIDNLDGKEGKILIDSVSEYAVTCIGTYPSTYWKNFRYMNIMNMNSMYNNYIIPRDYHMFFEAYLMIKKSIKMIKELTSKGL